MSVRTVHRNEVTVMTTKKNRALGACGAFLRAQYRPDDREHAARHLSEDVIWRGDTAPESAQGKRATLEMIEISAVFSAQSYEMQCLSLEERPLTADVSLVEGSLKLHDRQGSCAEEYRVAFTCVVSGGESLIRAVEFHRFHHIGQVRNPSDIQPEKDREVGIEALYRRSTTANAQLSMIFDLETGEVVRSASDVLPRWLPDGAGLSETITFLRDQAVLPDDRPSVASIMDCVKGTQKPDSASCECRLRAPGSAVGPRWVRLMLTTARDEPSRRAYAFLVMADVHERKLQEVRMWEQANMDPLTRLPNRLCFEQAVDRRLAAHDGARFALVIINIDHFEDIKRAKGHSGGNDVLRQAAQTIRASLHEGELCCRHGADGFALLMSKAEDESLLQERLRILCAALRRPGAPTVSASIGCALQDSPQCACASLIEQADRAINRAKICGGNQSVLYSPAIDAAIRRKQMPAFSHAGERRGRVFIRTFGHFDVFVDDKAVLFNISKAKELLALLVGRMGGFVSAGDAITCLWEDEPAGAVQLARYRKTAMHLKNILEKNGIGEIVEAINGKRRVVLGSFRCDSYDYLAGTPGASSIYNGAYLQDYSWAETTIGILDAWRNRTHEDAIAGK